MKKILFLILFAGSALSSLAYDYPYLAFQTSNGSVTTVAVESLTLTVSGSSLVATNDDGSVTLSLSDLSKMYFTTEAATGISNERRGGRLHHCRHLHRALFQLCQRTRQTWKRRVHSEIRK